VTVCSCRFLNRQFFLTAAAAGGSCQAQDRADREYAVQHVILYSSSERLISQLLETGETAADRRSFVYIDGGCLDYHKALELQLKLQKLRIDDRIPHAVLLLEHPPVITLGARKPENKLVFTRRQLEEKGIDIVQIGRGGGATAHNPGQLVVYPILKLPSLRLRIAPYVHLLERIGMLVLQSFGVQTHTRKRYPGIWTRVQAAGACSVRRLHAEDEESAESPESAWKHAKIASLGVQINCSTTMHGIAVNLCNDLSIFSSIVPCGIEGVQMTSAEEMLGGWSYSMSTVKERMVTLWEKEMKKQIRLPKQGS